jgi:hypothetical protein
MAPLFYCRSVSEQSQLTPPLWFSESFPLKFSNLAGAKEIEQKEVELMRWTSWVVVLMWLAAACSDNTQIIEMDPTPQSTAQGPLVVSLNPQAIVHEWEYISPLSENRVQSLPRGEAISFGPATREAYMRWREGGFDLIWVAVVCSTQPVVVIDENSIGLWPNDTIWKDCEASGEIHAFEVELETTIPPEVWTYLVHPGAPPEILPRATLTATITATPAPTPVATPVSAQVAPVMDEPPPGPTAVPVATTVSAATAIPERGTPAAPLMEAPYIRFAGWSPDSLWIAYWLSSPEDVEAQLPYTMPGGTLHLTNVATGEGCALSHFHTEAAGLVKTAWNEDGTLAVFTEEGAFHGFPCREETFTLLETVTPPVNNGEDRALSPDGRFQATTTKQGVEGGILTFETVLIDRHSSEVVQQVSWQAAEAKGNYGLGGEWVSQAQFLLYGAFWEGPLLIDVENGVIPVVTGLSGSDQAPTLLSDGYGLRAAAVPHPELDTFRLLLYGAEGFESEFPPIRLLHVDSGLVEELPFRYLWQRQPFSPDYKWLILDGRTPDDRVSLWTRRTEDVGGDWQQLTPAIGFGVEWNRGWNEMAFARESFFLTWQTFPDAVLIGRWHTEPYSVWPEAWSNDGRFLVATGNRPGQWQYGLFVIERP